MFWVFRRGLAEELRTMGMHVGVACETTDKADSIRDAGFELLPIPFARASVGPLSVAKAALAVRRVCREWAPSVVQAVALRPILVHHLGGVGIGGGEPHATVNLVTGLGSLFTGTELSPRLKLARFVVGRLFKSAFSTRGSETVFQNAEDRDRFVRDGLAPGYRTHLIRGSGVDTTRWQPHPEPLATGEPPLVLYVGRMLADKGLRELAEASSILHAKGVPHRLRLVGKLDRSNPSCIPEDEIRTWQARGIEWLGWRKDVLPEMDRANIVVLPSYREGLPKALLEAGVAQRAVVTCDTTGCRELVRHDENGLLTPPRDATALAAALERLLNDAELRTRLAHAHRERVCSEFSAEAVHRQYIALYARILAASGIRWPA